MNFIKKSYALQISSVVKVAKDNDAKCFYLLKYFLGGRLAGLRGEWTFLRDNASPSALSLTSFYDQVLANLLKLRVLCSDWRTFSFSSKNIYSVLLSELSSSPLLPVCLAKSNCTKPIINYFPSGEERCVTILKTAAKETTKDVICE